MPSSATSHLGPGDAAVAVRSFPRRFRSVLARPDEDERVEPDELARRIGPDGHAAADHLVAADAVLSLLGRSLEEARGGGDVTLHPAMSDLAGVWADDPHAPLGQLLDQFEATAAATAERIDAVSTEEWGRQVRVADAGAAHELLDVVRDAVDVTAGHLRAAERTIQAVR